MVAKAHRCSYAYEKITHNQDQTYSTRAVLMEPVLNTKMKLGFSHWWGGEMYFMIYLVKKIRLCNLFLSLNILKFFSNNVCMSLWAKKEIKLHFLAKLRRQRLSSSLHHLNYKGKHEMINFQVVETDS